MEKRLSGKIVQEKKNTFILSDNLSPNLNVIFSLRLAKIFCRYSKIEFLDQGSRFKINVFIPRTLYSV